MHLTMAPYILCWVFGYVVAKLLAAALDQRLMLSGRRPFFHGYSGEPTVAWFILWFVFSWCLSRGLNH